VLSYIILDKIKFQLLQWVLLWRLQLKAVYIITSSPRSGSTWLGNILSEMPESMILFEPLHLVHVPEAKKAGFDWRTYKEKEQDWEEGERFLNKIFSGRCLNPWTTRETTFKKALIAQRVIVKFVRANRLLPWITHHFQLPAPIFLLRHPCAVIASQLKSNDWNNIAKPSMPAFIDEYPVLKELFMISNSVEEYLALSWCLDQFPAFMHPKPYLWQVITYEELALSTHAVVDRINKKWNTKIKLNPEGFMQKSSVTHSTGISGVSGWLEQLSLDQKLRIMHIVHGFGFTFYSPYSPLPDLRLLDCMDLSSALSKNEKGESNL
jgi:hypothetical protein